jgi:hypothetical protein
MVSDVIQGGGSRTGGKFVEEERELYLSVDETPGVA